MIADETQDWPEFGNYDTGDCCILYEFEMPLPYDCYPPKLYDQIGFYIWVYPAEWEDHGWAGNDITGGLQFRHKASGSMLQADEWKSMEDEHFHRKTKLVQAHKIDSGHWQLGVDTMNKFVYEKLLPIMHRKNPHILLKTEPPKSMYDEIVEMMLEGEITRDRLNSVYNKLYKSAEKTLKHSKPCQVQKDAQGNTICAGCKGHPAHDPNDRMHDYFQTQANDLCCKGCEHHGEEGCKALKPLACKTWLCPTAAKNNPQTADRLSNIGSRAARARMYDVRGSKQQSMDMAARHWLQGDEETPVDQFKRWAKRVPGSTAEAIVNEMLDPSTFYKSFDAAQFNGKPIQAVFDYFNNNRGETDACSRCDGTGDDPAFDGEDDFGYHPCPACDGQGEGEEVDHYRQAVHLWNQAGPALDNLKRRGVLKKEKAIKRLFAYMNVHVGKGNYHTVVRLSDAAGREIEAAVNLLRQQAQQ